MATDFDNSAPQRSPRLRERLLGAFVIFELILIPFASYIKLVPVRIEEPHGELIGELQVGLREGATVCEPVQKVKDALAFAISRWGEVTGQVQLWSLFVSFNEQAAMPTVELHWPAELKREPVELR